jgi:effector-binding domain-containing protein
MNGATVIKQELKSFIDVIPDEEHALIAESVERYHKDPSSFVPLERIR